jgi:protocatechuate 3,4-dioxygenase beta subunit
MNRRKLLKSFGVIGVGSVLPMTKLWGKITPLNKNGFASLAGCWLTPQTTGGPFYFNANLFIQDIRYDFDTGTFYDGIQLNMTFTIIDVNCNPLSNVLVDIWHCDKDGCYSGYPNQPGGVNTTGLDFLRGIQLTDSNGQCSFITSYPGWYPGRATHIHFKVRLDSETFVTSQFAFPDSFNDAVYATPLYSGRGPNPTSNAEDNIFGSSKPEFLLMDVAPNAQAGYDGTYTIGINSPVGITEPDTSPQGFKLEQNYPNPFNPTTKIKYTISNVIANEVKQSQAVTLKVYDVSGNEIGTLVNSLKPAGSYEVTFDGSKLSSGIYFYRLTVGNPESSSGQAFTKTREMLLIK